MFRLDRQSKGGGICEIIIRNIEDYKKLGYDTSRLEQLYKQRCG